MEEKAHTHKFSLGISTLLLIKLKNPLLYDELIIRILKNVLRPLKGQVRIWPVNGRTRDGRRGNHQRRIIFHNLRYSYEGVASENDERCSR